MNLWIPLVAALPWVVAPLVIIRRAMASRTLNDWPEPAPVPTPRVSVVIPARNEARNIERCLTSVLASSYPALEVIVVDDHSSDGTAEVARAAAHGDPRVRIVTPDALPAGWFGKQWACHAAAQVATGDIYFFTDADTWHAPDLVGRSVNAMRARGAQLMTVAGTQELHSFWERVVQPQFFALLAARYGSTERVSRARRPTDAIANGQCIFITRAAYVESGGHEAVRMHVAEDLALAQRFARQGRPILLVSGLAQLHTRMYTSLATVIGGWQKNVYAGGREAMPGGRVALLFYPIILILAPSAALLPPAALVAGAAGWLGPAWLLWGAVGCAAALGFWAAAYAFEQLPIPYALLYPLGALIMLYIMITAVARGSHVRWKDRDYHVA